jgi:hypothetical protein
MTEEDLFDTGVSKEEYQYLNKGEKLEEFQWNKFFLGMYEDWIDKTDIHTPFAYLQKFLFPVHSYSKRIECVRYLQEAAIDLIDNELYSKEWSDDLAGYIRYNERLRDLKAQKFTVTPGCYSKVCWLDEVALLIEHIAPEEMLAFVTQAKRVEDLLSIRRSPKHVVTYYSLIFRENSTAGIGNMRLFNFCLEFVSIEGHRAQLISTNKGLPYTPLRPVSDECRTQCLEIYIQERIKHIREEIMEHDKTRPYKPSDYECMKLMYEQERNTVEAMVLIHNDELTPAWIKSKINAPEILEESQRRCEIKVKQLEEAYGAECCTVKGEDDIWGTIHDKLDYLVLLMQCYIRLLEVKINNEASKSSVVQADSKPTKEDLENLFTFKYRDSQSYKNLLEYLLGEKKKVGKGADADWRRHALVLFDHRSKIMTKKNRLNTFKEWLDFFCDLFGRPRVVYMEPKKVRSTKKQSPIDIYMPTI